MVSLDIIIKRVLWAALTSQVRSTAIIMLILATITPTIATAFENELNLYFLTNSYKIRYNNKLPNFRFSEFPYLNINWK